MTMNSLKFDGTWSEVKSRLRQKYTQLTDEDLLFIEGREDELYARLQERLGKSKEELRMEIEKY